MHVSHRRLTAALGALALSCTVVATQAPGAAAGSGDVADARAQMAALRQEVAKVAAELDRGTRAYQAGQRHLEQVQRRQVAARRQVKELAAASAADQQRLNQMAAAAYRRPVPGLLALALAGGGRALPEALSAQADLEHVAGSQQDVLRAAVRAHVRAQALDRTVEELRVDADRTTARLARELADLRRTADRASSRLQAAAARLAQAQAAEEARRAAADRARQAAASRSRVYVFSGPSCTGESTSGYANGFLPDSALCPLWEAPGQRLAGPAAAAFNRLSQEHASSAGGPLCVTDSYRSYSEQVSVYRRKPGLAATPGTSEHGWGQAVDLCGGVQRYGSDGYEWMKANAGRFGFVHPAWAEPGGGRPEPWHWEFVG